MYQRLFAMLIAFALLAGLTATPTVSAQGMKLQKGDHISIIGNALADRMQHDGWLETYLQSAMPNFQLSIRNLAFSGDQVAHRPRAHKAFGDANSHLTHTKASVIFRQRLLRGIPGFKPTVNTRNLIVSSSNVESLPW